MLVKYDAFNRFEHPKLTLCTPASKYIDGRITEVIGGIPMTSDEEIVANFNEVSSLNFACYKVDESEDPDNIYEIISEKQNVFVDDVGFFTITDVTEHITDELTYKDISAESCETELKNKTMPAAFYSQESNLDYAYNTTYRFDTLIEMLVRSIPRWSLSYVDESLSNKYRTFEDISEDTNILSFMLTEMQDAYECIFVFDILNRYIYIYSQDNYVRMTDIHISNEDIVNSITVSRTSDDIYTAISVLGDSDINIAGVNPIGTNVLYRYDNYFNSMAKELADKIKAWQDLVESYEDDYYSYNSIYYEKLGERSNVQLELGRISTQMNMYQKCKDNVVATSGLTDSNALCFTVSGDKAVQVANIVSEYNDSGTNIPLSQTFSEELTINGNKATTSNVAVGAVGSEISSLYIKNNEGVYTKQLTQSSTVSPDHFTYDSATKVLTFYTGQFPDGTKIGVFYHTNNSSAEDTIIVTNLIKELNDEIASLVFQQETQLSALDTINEELSAARENIEAIHSAVDMNTYFSNEELEAISLYTFEGEYKDEFITITESMTYPQQLDQMKILYDRAKIQLQKISTPTEQFSVDVENFIFQQMFQDWTEQLETGCLINVELKPGDIASLFLSNFTVNYEDESLSMTFGNRYNKFDPKTLFDNVLGNISRTSNSINFIKDTIYPITSGEFNEIKNALSQMRLLSAGQAITSQYQDFIIDSTGITGKQRSGESEFYPEQIKIVNNMIALTDDGWETCKLAIGKILMADGTYKYGVNAEVLMGDIILGNELHILGQNDNGDYVDIFSVMQERIEAHVPEIHAITTNTGYTFNDNGLMIERFDSEIVNVLNNEGMEVSLVNNSAPEEYTERIQVLDNKLTLTYPAIDLSDETFDINVVINDTPVTNLEYDENLHTVTILSPKFADGAWATVTYNKGERTSILTAKNDGVQTKNLVAHEYLQAGLHSRFENYSNDTDSNRTACFYI